MKVRVTMTVDVDPARWEEDFGVPRSEMREDVKTYVIGTVQGQLEHIDVLGPGGVR
jgi:hypothetical protein